MWVRADLARARAELEAEERAQNAIAQLRGDVPPRRTEQERTAARRRCLMAIDAFDAIARRHV